MILKYTTFKRHFVKIDRLNKFTHLKSHHNLYDFEVISPL